MTAIAGDLVGLHSSDAASVYLAAHARVRRFQPDQLEQALYEDRSLARVLGMRRTMFVVPWDLARIIHAAATRALARRERERTIQLIEHGGVAKDARRWLAKVEAATLELLEELGEATAVELSSEIPALQKKILVGEGKKWAGTIGVSTRVLFLLANDGKIVRTRPRGSWVSTQYRWVPMRSWFGVDIDTVDPESARAALVRRWLASFGPGTMNDLKWWTGWTVAETTRALQEVDAVEVDMDGSPGYLLSDDLETVRAPGDSVALLPSLDPTTMGWYERDWYLGEHRSTLFDRNGNAGPTVWWNGKVVGGWAQRPDGRVVVRILEAVAASALRAIDRQAHMVQEWLGDVRVIPRFRTPLERELSS